MRSLRTLARRRPRVSIGAFLATGLGALVAVPLVIVFVVSLGTAVRNTDSLLDERARLLTRLVTDETRAFLEPAEAAPSFVARLIERGAVDPDNQESIANSIRYTFAAAPQLNSVV